MGRIGSWVAQQLLIGLAPGDVRRGMALFATERPGALHVLHLARPVADALTWADLADIDPLETFQARYPAMGVLVLDHDSLRLIGTLLDDVIEEVRYEIDRDTSG